MIQYKNTTTLKKTKAKSKTNAENMAKFINSKNILMFTPH